MVLQNHVAAGPLREPIADLLADELKLSGFKSCASSCTSTMVSTGTLDSSKNGSSSPRVGAVLLATRRVCAGIALALLGQRRHREHFAQMHLRRIRLRREALALLAEHLAPEPVELMLSRAAMVSAWDRTQAVRVCAALIVLTRE